jgi:hypothetical protein
MAVKVATLPVETLIPENVPKIFEQAQVSTTNHQKNFVALYKLHAEAATLTDLVQDGRSLKLVGEKLFEDVFMGLVARALPVKKGATVVDRIVRFIAGYAKFINDKGMAFFWKRRLSLILHKPKRRKRITRTNTILTVTITLRPGSLTDCSTSS